MKFSRESAGPSAFPSPESRETDDGCESPLDTTAPGRLGAQPEIVTKKKRENRYKNAPPSVLSRRRAQNRASQRAYRERKDQRIKDLEEMLNDARVRNNILSHAYADLQAEYTKLKLSPLPASNLEAQTAHSQPHQSSSSMTTSYAAVPDSSVSVDLSGAFVDANCMTVLNAGNDLESYLYPDVGGYCL
ncbi:hypothetical protein N0V93_000697 [Gnomoniopsis smithogilvyi]|uniref:Putative transcription factor kapC n=1 Tax=Gnomoniopsis smithogilvyi TaxID=1191159 RepID=A0A9W8Z2A0_9PEZI|nr:hypothetical protein N0V93_000697 [Gnomoniopsis smithogilvyi]